MPKNTSPWSLYLIRCSDNSLYTGITNDVERRFAQHSEGGKQCAKYLRGRGPLVLAFHAKVGNKSQALKAERRVKRLSRARKQQIIRGELKLLSVLGT